MRLKSCWDQVLLGPSDNVVDRFPIQKQGSTRSSASESNTNRDVDKNSDTVNLTYTKATKKRKISNAPPSPNPEKSVLSVKAKNN